jgi:hypothetical protein
MENTKKGAAAMKRIRHAPASLSMTIDTADRTDRWL